MTMGVLSIVSEEQYASWLHPGEYLLGYHQVVFRGYGRQYEYESGEVRFEELYRQRIQNQVTYLCYDYCCTHTSNSSGL